MDGLVKSLLTEFAIRVYAVIPMMLAGVAIQIYTVIPTMLAEFAVVPRMLGACAFC